MICRASKSSICRFVSDFDHWTLVLFIAQDNWVWNLPQVRKREETPSEIDSSCGVPSTARNSSSIWIFVDTPLIICTRPNGSLSQNLSNSIEIQALHISLLHGWILKYVTSPSTPQLSTARTVLKRTTKGFELTFMLMRIWGPAYWSKIYNGIGVHDEWRPNLMDRAKRKQVLSDTSCETPAALTLFQTLSPNPLQYANYSTKDPTTLTSEIISFPKDVFA